MKELNNNKQQIIEKISRIKNISVEQAQQLFEALETYCELIINFTLNENQ